MLYQIGACCLVGVVFLGCSTFGPESSIPINGERSLSWSEVHEIQGLLPSLGIKHGITEITLRGADRAVVYCQTRPPPYPISTDGGDGIEFTVVCRQGHWIAVGPPRKSERVVVSG